MTQAEAERILESAVEKLGEHFDAVQIFGTWCDEGSTKFLPRGSGNWYARQGMAHEFINRDISGDAAEQIAAKLKESED